MLRRFAAARSILDWHNGFRSPEPAPTVQQLLAFYLEAGVDCALAEEPVDRLAEPDAP